MSRSIPVPWYRWKRFRVSGSIRDKETGRPLPGLIVSAFDKDLLKDDFLGSAETDEAGRFEIRFMDVDFKDLLESRPDLFLRVFLPGAANPVLDTSYEIRRNANDEEVYEIEIPGSPA
jgi:carotenoid cleavage dioxygenase